MYEKCQTTRESQRLVESASRFGGTRAATTRKLSLMLLGPNPGQP